MVSKTEVEQRKKAILDYIMLHPGCSVTEIAKDLELHRSNVRKMIRGFEKSGALKPGAVKTRKDYEKDREKRIEKIIEMLRTTRGMTIKDLADIFGMSECPIDNDIKIIEKRARNDPSLRDLHMPVRRDDTRKSILSAVAEKPASSEDELAAQVGVDRSTVVRAFKQEGGRANVIFRSGGEPWKPRLEEGYFKKLASRKIFFVYLTAKLGYFPIEETTEIFAPMLGGEKVWGRISWGTLRKEYPPFDKIVGFYSKHWFHQQKGWTTTELIRYDWQQALNSSLYLVFCAAADILPSEWMRNDRDSLSQFGAEEADARALEKNRRRLRKRAVPVTRLAREISNLRLKYRPVLLVRKNKSKENPQYAIERSEEERLTIVKEKNGTTSFSMDRELIRDYLKTLVALGLIREIDGKIAYVPLKYKKLLAVHKKLRGGKTGAT